MKAGHDGTHLPVQPQEAQIGELQSQPIQEQKQDPISKLTKPKKVGGMTQVVVLLY
jgi:hypothetical protein